MDWTLCVTAASLIGTIANIYKKQWCFIIWFFTNTFWCVYDFYKELYSQGLLFLIYVVLAVWGIVKWKRSEGVESMEKD